MNKKVVIIQPLLAAKRGPWRFINEIAKRLKSKGYNVAIYTVTYQKSLTFNFDGFAREIAGGKLKKKLFKTALSIWRKLGKFEISGVPLSAFVSPILILLSIIKEKPDVVFVNEGAVFCGIIKKLLKILYFKPLTIILYYHKPGPDTRANTLLAKLLRPFEFVSLKKCIPVTNSSYFASIFKYLTGVKPHVIHPGVDVEEFIRIPRLDDGKTLLYVGAFSPEKRQIFLIRIIHRLRQRGVPAKLILAGSLGPKEESIHYYKFLLKMIKELKLQDMIKVLPNVDDESLKLLYSKATIYLNPIVEGFGINIVEALAAGIPVICYKVGGQLDIVKHGINGLIVGDNEEEWVNAIIELLRNKGLRERMSKVARERAMHFSWDKTVEKIEQIILTKHS